MKCTVLADLERHKIDYWLLRVRDEVGNGLLMGMRFLGEGVGKIVLKLDFGDDCTTLKIYMHA